ncbi:hypothetical protein PTTG_29931 [Puccinia triticina 1-1 BBBD Race 1]|uniref:DDE Tnp4 domain-containing protein n=1 Tax=Puccinia triticina (isolate 1-1 / race 1 (BBBD)) TaxID=630390 RepID=A0A180G1E6_PUCT1|nr:hypothetical protein PTTG_29931 [Puccinia triticina 1-1 BBBD Race 1]
MHKYSERQQVIRDLFMMIIFLHHQETDDMLDSILRIPTVPSLGATVAPDDPGHALVLELLFEDEETISDMLGLVLSNRYLHTRSPGKTHDKYNLVRLFEMRDEDFKQAVRTTQSGFVWLLEKIYANPIFQSNSPRQQLPIPHQLALTLERLGSNGNGASVGRFARNLCVGRGTVVKITRRVVRAINDLSGSHLIWPDANRRREISDVMKAEGFKGCVGFVDGTTIPLYQRPSIDGEVFFDQKKRYSINCQIVCDCDRYITAYMTGWPGSCGDSLVFKKMKLWSEPKAHFDPGQYLIADSAYELSRHCIPAYKAPAAYIKENTEFNYCLARSRHLQLAIQKPSDMKQIIQWVHCCVTLHNMLASLGDSWDVLDTPAEDSHPAENSNDDSARSHRNSVQSCCLQTNYSLGVLPL